MVVDYEENKVMFKDNPDVWHTLPTTKKGLMMIPLTKEACGRHAIVPPPPKPTAQTKQRRRRTEKSLIVAGCSCEGPVVCHHEPKTCC